MRSISLFTTLTLTTSFSQAFVPAQTPRLPVVLSSSAELTTDEPSMADNLELLKRAAVTKQEDSDAVFNALSALEKQMRQQARDDPAVADSVLANLNGDWRLIFTTGTIDTQERTGGRINYFPIKAVQSFRTDGMKIENGIYFGDFPAVKFGGEFEFNLKTRKLEFDFGLVTLLGFLEIKLGSGEAADLGAKSGLGSKNNVTSKRKPFFNWISADESIATARGGGGGLALWKRVG